MVTAAAGFFLASAGKIDILLFFSTLFGLALIIASGCVFNNFLDRKLDQKMERTKNRALAVNKIPILNALVFGAILAIIGTLVLALKTNSLTVFLALAGLFLYVVVYGAAKRLSIHGTLVGSLSGAIPPVAGYCAATGNLDLAALILFIILVAWQMPHFYAIAIYRLDDYKNAGLPVLPVKSGIEITKKHMLFYIYVYLFATLSLSVAGYTGYVYFAVATLLGLGWLFKAFAGSTAKDDQLWAKGIFRYSLICLSVLCLTIYLDPLLV